MFVCYWDVTGWWKRDRRAFGLLPRGGIGGNVKNIDLKIIYISGSWFVVMDPFMFIPTLINVAVT